MLVAFSGWWIISESELPTLLEHADHRKYFLSVYVEHFKSDNKNTKQNKFILGNLFIFLSSILYYCTNCIFFLIPPAGKLQNSEKKLQNYTTVAVIRCVCMCCVCGEWMKTENHYSTRIYQRFVYKSYLMHQTTMTTWEKAEY